MIQFDKHSFQKWVRNHQLGVFQVDPWGLNPIHSDPLPSWELTYPGSYPIIQVTLELMIFRTSQGGICDRFLYEYIK